MPTPPEMPHVVSPIVDATFGLLPDSLLAQRSLAVIEHFDIPLPASNPRLLEMFKDRNRRANGKSMTQMAWAGEFVGKWLTHASQLYRLTRHPELKATIQMAVDTLAKYQAPDGYLGPWMDASSDAPPGHSPNPPKSGTRTMKAGWDAWGHYHAMLGCLLWSQCVTDNPTALSIATKIADMMCATFPGSDPKKFFDQGSLEQNMAILHSMAIMFTKTKMPKYLTFCKMVVQELTMPPGPLNSSLIRASERHPCSIGTACAFL